MLVRIWIKCENTITLRERNVSRVTKKKGKTLRKTHRTVAEIALAGLMLVLAVVIVEMSPHAAPLSQNVSPEKSDAPTK